MYTVTIRDHIMIAHSLKNEAFGPAQKMHGATYVVDATFMSEQLNDANIVIDIALAHKVLKHVLSPLNYQNLDELPELKNELTTTEFLARYIHQKISEEVKVYFSGRLKVNLGESHVAWAGYEGNI
ncbi:6-carboxytetrahydropterin synthase [Fulvivirgaceae bacterium BMA10]|uniref:6-carboxy-5,6,7,8-tetrahydropterin synthase n=1 Tax=Splendidivirga corallicola TaxID=3051826 RepID=A0ABT8KPE5_9BACT|nr:6-carboxytetrahydropterin synthase [Fulvivirgaceae bacterium BMA10]